MRWQSLVPIIIGGLIVAEYFVGFDGHGHGAGNPITLVFGLAFVAIASYSATQRAGMRKKMAARLDLQDDASWTDIEQALERKKSSVK